MQFRGKAQRLGNGAVVAAAQKLECEEAAVRAVIDVESSGGFDAMGRPKILFERHYFHRLTAGRFDGSHADISAPAWGGYGTAGAQYVRLARAIACHRGAALRSASWGMFQIMGDNFIAAGFTDIDGFVAAMMEGEDRHLAAFVSFVQARRLAQPLARGDWRTFARGYNGPAFAQNRYDERLADAYARHAVLRRGTRGPAVRALQARLGMATDGKFGPETEAALMAFQAAAGLAVDGAAGPATRAALSAG